MQAEDKNSSAFTATQFYARLGKTSAPFMGRCCVARELHPLAVARYCNSTTEAGFIQRSRSLTETDTETIPP